MSLWIELKRRNMFHVAAPYVVIGWLMLQVARALALLDPVFDRHHDQPAFRELKARYSRQGLEA